jgi:hypothetical protein
MDGGVLEVPQFTSSMGAIEIRMAPAVFLTDMEVPSLFNFEQGTILGYPFTA